tara:strand:- start:83 stop:934 length:852 start_codon:yes stop_codon:yes gene_type:complete
MATINLGSIKFNWKGTYAGGTAYVVDDVVEYNGSSYICIQASTGNLPTDTAYFEQMSSAGTNGTDVGTTLTTQGDILYRDGSGLQRLPKGTAGQVLQMNSGATAPEYGTVSSDMVLINTTTLSGASVVIDNIFSATYKNYKVFISNAYASSDYHPRFRFRTGASSLSSGVYTYAHWRVEQNSSTSGSALTVNSWQETYGRIHQELEGNNGNKTLNAEIHLFDPYNTAWNFWRTQSVAWDNGGNWVVNMTGGGTAVDGTSKTGLVLYPSAGTWSGGTVKVYGLK